MISKPSQKQERKNNTFLYIKNTATVYVTAIKWWNYNYS